MTINDATSTKMLSFLYNSLLIVKRHEEFSWGNLLESSHLMTKGENNIKMELDKTCHEDINQFNITYNGTTYQTSRYFYWSFFVSMMKCLANKECFYMSKFDLCHFSMTFAHDSVTDWETEMLNQSLCMYS
jgi:hypothetical protein